MEQIKTAEALTGSFANNVAAVVKQTIEASDLSPVQVSEHTGIPRTTLLRRLSGATPFTVAELDAIARCLGRPVTDLLQVAA